jgi:hypothetical protein
MLQQGLGRIAARILGQIVEGLDEVNGKIEKIGWEGKLYFYYLIHAPGASVVQPDTSRTCVVLN